MYHISNVYGRGPFLVVVPLSTLAHWKREFEGWTDFNVVVYHGYGPSQMAGSHSMCLTSVPAVCSTKADRQMIQLYEWYFWDTVRACGGVHGVLLADPKHVLRCRTDEKSDGTTS